MSRTIPCPVPITCPDIDLVLKKLNYVVDNIERLEKLLNSDLLRDILNDLEDIVGSYSISSGLMEKLRSANSELREWGNESNSIIEELEEEIEELKNKE